MLSFSRVILKNISCDEPEPGKSSFVTGKHEESFSPPNLLLHHSVCPRLTLRL